MTPVVMRSRGDWPLIVEAVHKRAGKQPLWKCLTGYYNVCVTSIVTPESTILWQMYMRSGKGSNETWESYLNMPAIVAEAFELFDVEIGMFERAKEKEDRRRLAAEIKRVKGHGRK